MDLRTLLRVLGARWKLAVGALIACVAVSAIIAWAQTPTYTAHTQLFASSTEPGASYQGALFSEQRVLSYVQMVTSPPVLTAVIRQLGLSEDSRKLASKIHATVPTGTVLLDVGVQDRSATRAAAIARALAAQFATFVSRLEKPPGTGGARASVTVTSPAEVPPSPSSPRKKVYLAIGLLLGLVAGVGGAVGWEALDRRVRTNEEAAELTGAPVLANLDERAGASVGEYRRLVTTIAASVDSGRLRSLTVTSVVSGEGKSMIAANLGAAFAAAGRRVVVVETNLGQPELAAILGVSASPGLAEVLRDGLPVSSALKQCPGAESLSVLPAGSEPAGSSGQLASPKVPALIAELTERCDLVIVDAPPLLDVADAAAVARATSGVLIVATSGATRADDLAAAAAALRNVDASTIGVVLNRRSAGRRTRMSASHPSGDPRHETLASVEGERVSTG